MNKRIIVALGGVLFLVVVLGSILATGWTDGWIHETQNINNELSNAIFNEYGVAILVVGLVLFVSMLGGVFLAQEENE